MSPQHPVVRTPPADRWEIEDFTWEREWSDEDDIQVNVWGEVEEGGEYDD